jgi:tripartite ATP-independent transporter DctM subunit
MSPAITGLAGVVLFLIVVFSGVPISFAMLFTGFWGLCFLRSPAAAFDIVAKDLFSTFSSYSLTVIPMFVYMGFIAFHSGIGKSLFNLSHKFVGHFRGGLAIASEAACALFGAVSGSSTAGVATIGTIAIPEMRKYNYDSSLATASIAAGASLGSLIPPSVLFIVYGIATEQSIGKLFLAGILPGILLMVLYMLTIIISCKFNPSLAPAGQRATRSEKIEAFRGGLIEVFIVFIISLGGLFLGWFTPTEAGAVGAVCLMVITLLEKKMDWNKTMLALLDSTKLSAMIFLLIAGATIFGRFFALTRIPFDLGMWVTGMNISSFAVLMVVLFIYLILGCFIDALALMLLTIPIFYPLVVTTLGYDPIWFGVIMLLVVNMGVITPPIGLNVFVVKGVAPDVPLETIFRGIWPFLIAIVVCIIILILFPQIATVLPDMLM